MTAIRAALRGVTGRAGGSGDLDLRITALDDAVEATRGRLDDVLVDDAAAVADRARSRMRLSADHTIVALVGATGSGKSSTFNALAGLDLARVGVRRPTTATTTACVWGDHDAAEILDWLEIPERHRAARESSLDETPKSAAQLDGLVLLDLPDHDSTEVTHHLEVDRLVNLADVLVFVLDPQKYADAAVHRRLLGPLAGHAGVIVVTLNHVDEVPQSDRPGVLADIRRLLDADGLAGVPVIATSASTGEGIDGLRAEIKRRVADKAASRKRLRSDLQRVGGLLANANGEARTPQLLDKDTDDLDEAVADAAGVPLVTRAVRRASTQRARRATGWPLTKWLGGLRPNPLKRLHLDRGHASPDVVARTSIPAADHVQVARVETALRGLGDQVSQDLSRPWALAVRRAATARTPDLIDRLDKAVASTELGLGSTPRWCRGVRWLQWLLFIVAIAGALWLAGLALLGYLRLDQPSTPRLGGAPWPTLLLVGAVAIGLLVAFVSRGLIGVGSARRARRAERQLRDAVDLITDELVVGPMRAELERYDRARSALRLVRG